MLLLQLHFNIYSVLNENNLYFYVVWFVHILWLVQPAVFESFDHYMALVCGSNGPYSNFFNFSIFVADSTW